MVENHVGKIRGQTSKADKQEGEEEEMEDVLSHVANAVWAVQQM